MRLFRDVFKVFPRLPHSLGHVPWAIGKRILIFRRVNRAQADKEQGHYDQDNVDRGRLEHWRDRELCRNGKHCWYLLRLTRMLRMGVVDLEICSLFPPAGPDDDNGCWAKRGWVNLLCGGEVKT